MPRLNPSNKVGARSTTNWTHGRAWAYKNGCRCDECRYAHRLAFPRKNPEAPEEMCVICGRWYQHVARHETGCVRRHQLFVQTTV